MVIKLHPLRDLDVDIWSNRVGTYHKFEMDVAIPKKENDSNHVDTSATDDTPSLRNHDDINYSPMLTSEVESEYEIPKKKPKNYRPSANGPSVA